MKNVKNIKCIKIAYKKVSKSAGRYFMWLPENSGRDVWYIQSNLAISNSVNSKSPLFRRKIECPWIYPSPLRFPGYFEAPLFRTFFHFPCDFEIAGFDCNMLLNLPYPTLPYQEIRLQELVKWSPKRECFDLFSNSLNKSFKEMYRDQLREFVCRY